MNRTFALSLAAVVSMHAHAADLVSGSITAVDTAGGGSSFSPLFSADATKLLFVSHAPNLTTHPIEATSLNLFMRDRAGSNTVLVSISTNGTGANGMCLWPSASSNGQFVAFASDADNLVANDSNKATDIFVRDVVGGATKLITVDTNGNSVGGDTRIVPVIGRHPLISADGRWVFFDSTASSLTLDYDANGASDVFARDTWSNKTVLVSSRWNLVRQTPGAASTLADITPNGSTVALLSFAGSDLINEAGNPIGPDVYIRRMESNTMSWASRMLSSYFPGGYRCTAAGLSANGQFAWIVADAQAPPSVLFRVELASLTATVVSSNIWTNNLPGISSTGRFVLYEDGTNVYRWDGDTALPQAVNVDTNGVVPAGVSRHAVMSADGNRIAFSSDAPGLTAEASNRVVQLYVRDMAAGITRLITATPAGAASAAPHDGSTFEIAADGSAAAFDSIAGDLAPSDLNGASDVFVRNLSASSAELVSVRHPALTPRRTPLGAAFVTAGSISSNGNVVAFTRYDSDLLPGDTNGITDAFLANLAGQQITGAGQDSNANAIRAVALSGNGRYLVVVRSSLNGERLMRFDRTTGSNELLFATSPIFRRDGSAPAVNYDGSVIAYRNGNLLQLFNADAGTNEFTTNVTVTPLTVAGELRDAALTPDGRFCVFATGSTYLYVWDRVARRLLTNDFSTSVALSADSRFLVSASWDLHQFNLVAGVSRHVGDFLLDVGTSGDGRYIVGSTSNSYFPQIVLLDSQTGQTNLLSLDAAGTPANRGARYPVISANGRFVAFQTQSTNLVPGNTSPWRQIVLRDRLLGTSTLLSAGLNGAPANYHVSKPIISDDGSTLIFHSGADNLVAGDVNNARDVFAVKLGVDSDDDGLDDDWEVAYFGDLSHDGSADSDGDGVSDRDEFLAGTDPTNSGSVFRVVVLAQLGTSTKQLLWTGNASRSYRVEYKDDLGVSSWTPLAATITWSGSTAAAVDSAAGTNRFYRVVRLP